MRPKLSNLPQLAHEPLLGCAAAIAGYAAVLAWAGDGRQVLELVIVLAAAGAGLAGAPTRRAAALAALAYLLVETAAGRLGFDSYWKHALALALLTAAVVTARAARARRLDDAHALAGARAALEAERGEDELERLLAGGAELTPADRELRRARRHDHAAGLLLLRPDGVEEAPAGALREVAAAVGRHLRTSDVAYRRPPFDIVLLLPETELAGARVAAERLRLAVAAETSATVSVGAATFPSATTREALLERAEQALAEAVSQGGNRTVLASVPAGAPARWGLPATPRTRD